MAYSASQLDYAKQIVSVGNSMGMTPRDEKIALTVALAESDLQNYANSKVPSSYLYPHDNVGSDGFSVGIFQQQVGIWGAPEELMNPEVSARKFYAALKNVPGRDTLSIPQAAQTVQRSAFSDGSNYAKRQADAEALYNMVSGNPGNSSGSSSGASNWFSDHGGWKRLGVYVVGGALVWLAMAIWFGESRVFKDAVKLGVKAL